MNQVEFGYIAKPAGPIKNKGKKEYDKFRAMVLKTWEAERPVRHCEGVWKQGKKVKDCPDKVQDILVNGEWTWKNLIVGHKQGRLTHTGAPMKMNINGVVPQCELCNAESSGNKIMGRE